MGASGLAKAVGARTGVCRLAPPWSAVLVGTPLTPRRNPRVVCEDVFLVIRMEAMRFSASFPAMVARVTGPFDEPWGGDLDPWM